MERNSEADSSTPARGPAEGSAFLLAQLGARAAQRFAERIAALDLTPPQAGLLRAVARQPGQSQQALARHLGVPATRLVSLVDGLESRGIVQRRRNTADRRVYAVHLTEEGARFMERLGGVAAEHEAAMVAGLEPAERTRLFELLTRVAAEQGLTEGVHPGYRELSADGRRGGSS